MESLTDEIYQEARKVIDEVSNLMNMHVSLPILTILSTLQYLLMVKLFSKFLLTHSLPKEWVVPFRFIFMW